MVKYGWNRGIISVWDINDNYSLKNEIKGDSFTKVL